MQTYGLEPQPWVKVNQSDDRYFEGNLEALKNVEHIKDYGEHGFFPVFGGKM